MSSGWRPEEKKDEDFDDDSEEIHLNAQEVQELFVCLVVPYCTQCVTRTQILDTYTRIPVDPALSNAGIVVTKSGTSNEECERACLESKELYCRYYKFSKSRSTCFFTTAPDPAVHGLKRVNRPEPGPVSQPASSWIAELQARMTNMEQKNLDIKKLHKDVTDLRAEFASLKNSRAMTHHLLRKTKEEEDRGLAAVDEKTEQLKSESKRVEDAVMTLGELQKTFGDKVRKLNQAQKESDLTMAMVSQSSKDMRSSVRVLAETATELKTSLTAVKKVVTELQVRFAGLSTDVMDRVANIDTMIGPELKELRDSQTTLAQALSLLTKKMMVLTPRLPSIQKHIDSYEQKLIAMRNIIKEFRKTIGSIESRVDISQTQLKEYLDPGSRMNTMRRHVITQLRGDVASLQDGQKRVQNDVLAEMSDRTRLYRELGTLKVDRKALVDKVVRLEQAVRRFKDELRNIVTHWPQARVVSHILNRQVAAIKSLKSLKLNQLQMRALGQRYRSAILKNHKYSLRNGQTEKMVEQAMKIVKRKLRLIFNKRQNSKEIKSIRLQLVQLIKWRKEMVSRIAKMQGMQEALLKDLVAYKKNANLENKRLKEFRQRQRQNQEQQATLRSRMASLYNTVKTRLRALEPSMRRQNYTATLQNLRRLAHTQIAVMRSVADYRSALSSTRNELMGEKRRQLQANVNAKQIGRQIKDLQKQLGKVLEVPEKVTLVQKVLEGRLNVQKARLDDMQLIYDVLLPRQAGHAYNADERKRAEGVAYKFSRSMAGAGAGTKARTRRLREKIRERDALMKDTKQLHSALSRAEV